MQLKASPSGPVFPSASSGRVLTATDSEGNATWQDLPTSGSAEFLVIPTQEPVLNVGAPTASLNTVGDIPAPTGTYVASFTFVLESAGHAEGGQVRTLRMTLRFGTIDDGFSASFDIPVHFHTTAGSANAEVVCVEYALTTTNGTPPATGVFGIDIDASTLADTEQVTFFDEDTINQLIVRDSTLTIRAAPPPG